MREKQSRATQERHDRMLKELFKLPGNDRCADCTAKNPRWASHSLGIFLCIRCASLHRKMGTHISKVKSVSMDCWTLQEIQNMKKSNGNQTVNTQINSNSRKHPLPIALDDDNAMEKYIRDKWEKKLFVEQAYFTQEPISLSSQEDLSSSSQEDLVPTPTLSSTNSSFVVSSPVVAPLAGRVIEHTTTSTNTITNPFASNPIKSHNPFAISSSSSPLAYFGVTQPTTNIQHVVNSSNPFLQQNQQQHHCSNNNPFFQQQHQGNLF